MGCDFEEDSVCDFTNDSEDDADWEIVSGKWPSLLELSVCYSLFRLYIFHFTLLFVTIGHSTSICTFTKLIWKTISGFLYAIFTYIYMNRCWNTLNQSTCWTVEKFSCDFQPSETNVPLFLISGSTLTQGTGPESAHSGEKYLYLESSYPISPRSKARLLSPTIHTQGQRIMQKINRF